MSAKDGNCFSRSRKIFGTIFLFASVLFLNARCAHAAHKVDAKSTAPAVTNVLSQTPVQVPYVPPSGEFSILLPGKVTTGSVPGPNMQVPTYMGRFGTTNYVVTSANVGQQSNGFDQYMNGFVGSLKKRGDMSVAVSDMSGQGWTGKLCNFTRNGSERLAAIVAQATGTTVIYSAMIDAPATSDQAKKFFSSFIVYPDKVKEAHQNDPGAGSSSAYEIGRAVGSFLGPLLLLALGIFLYKRSSRQTKKEDESN